MEIIIENESGMEFLPEYEEIIKICAEKTLLYEGFHTDVEISVLIVNNDIIRELNHERRFVDKETDVLSFPLLEPEDIEESFSAKEKFPLVYLGDIVLSIEKAQFQAIDYGHSTEREIAFLCVHSMLHLLGYDHETEQDETEMFAKQEDILSKAGYLR